MIHRAFLGSLAAAGLAAAPALAPAPARAAAPAAAGSTKAEGVLSPTKGSSVSGKVVFTKVDGGVKVSAHVAGLTPGLHGFHIHEFGDCGAPDGSSAGGHFNPSGSPHAGPNDAMRHEGDLGNIEAGKEGTADLEYMDTKGSFEGPANILGRGVIVHASADDFKTQPTGNAGGRLACGVIGVVKGE